MPVVGHHRIDQPPVNHSGVRVRVVVRDVVLEMEYEHRFWHTLVSFHDLNELGVLVLLTSMLNATFQDWHAAHLLDLRAEFVFKSRVAPCEAVTREVNIVRVSGVLAVKAAN